MNEIAVNIPGHVWMSANDRLFWATKASKTATVRQAVALVAGQAIAKGELDRMERARIIAHVSMPTARRSDPGNASPTVKAMIDGLVDAGVLPDDDKTHVIGPDYRPAEKTGMRGVYRIRLELREVHTVSVGTHEFLPVAGHPDDDECTYRPDGTDDTYCGLPRECHQ